MYHADTLELYRRMTPKQRIADMLAQLDVADAALRTLSAEERDRRLEAADRIHRSSIDALLVGLRRLEESRGDADRA